MTTIGGGIFFPAYHPAGGVRLLGTAYSKHTGYASVSSEEGVGFAEHASVVGAEKGAAEVAIAADAVGRRSFELLLERQWNALKLCPAEGSFNIGVLMDNIETAHGIEGLAEESMYLSHFLKLKQAFLEMGAAPALTFSGDASDEFKGLQGQIEDQSLEKVWPHIYQAVTGESVIAAVFLRCCSPWPYAGAIRSHLRNSVVFSASYRSVTFLILRHIGLSSLPSEVYSSLPSLRFLDLSENPLKGRVRTDLLPQLEELVVSRVPTLQSLAGIDTSRHPENSGCKVVFFCSPVSLFLHDGLGYMRLGLIAKARFYEAKSAYGRFIHALVYEEVSDKRLIELFNSLDSACKETISAQIRCLREEGVLFTASRPETYLFENMEIFRQGVALALHQMAQRVVRSDPAFFYSIKDELAKAYSLGHIPGPTECKSDLWKLEPCVLADTLAGR